MWGLLRVLKDLAFSDPSKGEVDHGPPDDDERRDDGQQSRGGMTKEQFFSELEKLTEN